MNKLDKFTLLFFVKSHYNTNLPPSSLEQRVIWVLQAKVCHKYHNKQSFPLCVSVLTCTFQGFFLFRFFFFFHFSFNTTFIQIQLWVVIVVTDPGLLEQLSLLSVRINAKLPTASRAQAFLRHVVRNSVKYTSYCQIKVDIIAYL